MSYAELLQAWRAGVLPVRNRAGRKREAPQAPNGGNLPVIPVIPGTGTEGEQKAEPAPKSAHVDTRVSAPVLALVRCGQCRHFEPNPNNRAQGLGRCVAGVESERLPWPNAPRHCATWSKSGQTPAASRIPSLEIALSVAALPQDTHLPREAVIPVGNNGKNGNKPVISGYSAILGGEHTTGIEGID